MTSQKPSGNSHSALSENRDNKRVPKTPVAPVEALQPVKDHGTSRKMMTFWEDWVPGEFSATLLSAFLMIALFNILVIPVSASQLVFIESMDFRLFFLIFVVVTLCFVGIRNTLKTPFIFPALILLTHAFGFMVIHESSRNVYLSLGTTAIVGFITYAALQAIKDRQPSLIISDSFYFKSLVGFSVLMAVLLAAATIFRYKTFGASNFDFGIFAQMFEYMKTTGLPYTTVERNQFLSHFAIHFSPIFYLLLPGYLLFSSPEYLLAAQAVAICSAAFPVYLLCRHFKFTSSISMLIACIYLVYPGVIAPAFYDFHENKLLTALLLWTLYFLEKNRPVCMYLFMLLSMMVKEDAPLYIMAIGLFGIAEHSQRKRGLVMLVSAVAYFIIVTKLMTLYGHGIMDDRFNAFKLPGQDGLLPVIENILMNPLIFITTLFTEQKFQFIVFMMAPLLFIPLIPKNMKNLLLLIPMLVINLMTTYPYQFQVGFQYTYGVSALLFYLFILNLRSFTPHWQKTVCIVAVFSSLTLMHVATGSSFTHHWRYYNAFKQEFHATESILSTIPVNATVTAETYIIPHLYTVKQLYMYPAEIKTEYLVFMRNNMKENAEAKNRLIFEGGYVLESESERVLVYRRPADEHP